MRLLVFAAVGLLFQAGEEPPILTAMRAYAADYGSRLPNFLCTRATTHFESGIKKVVWHKRDTLLEQLSFVDGHEKMKPISGKHSPPHDRLTTEGEFGGFMKQIFDAASDTDFDCSAEGECKFSIDKAHSTLRLSLFGVSAILAYHGTIAAHPENGVITRIHLQADAIPEELQAQSFETAIDYAPVQIAGATYMLPSRAVIVERHEKGLIRNEIRFENYRRFGSESTIRFGDTGP